MMVGKPWTEERLMKRVLVTEECWLWYGTRNANGYGVVKVGGRAGKKWLVHRLIDTFRNGPIPPGACVLHRCDMPACVRPDHLWRGTQTDNVNDMDAKGRGRRHFTLGRAPAKEAA